MGCIWSTDEELTNKVGQVQSFRIVVTHCPRLLVHGNWYCRKKWTGWYGPRKYLCCDYKHGNICQNIVARGQLPYERQGSRVFDCLICCNCNRWQGVHASLPARKMYSTLLPLKHSAHKHKGCIDFLPSSILRPCSRIDCSSVPPLVKHKGKLLHIVSVCGGL